LYWDCFTFALPLPVQNAESFLLLVLRSIQ
jgi:hypothetical protein